MISHTRLSTHEPAALKTGMLTAPVALFDNTQVGGAAMTFERNAEIYGEGEDADYVYKVLSGSVRTYKVLSDGRRQVTAFYLPGDVFGIESDDEHASSAEAIDKSVILLVRRNSLFNLAESNGEVARHLWEITAAELRRSQNHALLLIKTAKERLAAFLLDMAKRLAGKGCVELPMSRQDIADYLGLTIETVSRTLTSLSEGSTIQFLASRRIVLRNPSELDELNA
ncbi:MAG TPA: helix-turn-helix domain-containing protein [Hyphomicrobiaceae bacterium]|nr:helix-turn-helix domain-containing protein [Hyphomicrobiaceae bacterium]